MREIAINEILLGASTVMQRLRERIVQLAPLQLSVVIEGSTGAGKELVARGLHRESGRTGALVAVNVCAVSDGLFESSFLGHAREAFTGAQSDRDGYFVEADGGTLFVDEIGGLSPALQIELLRAIETSQVRPARGRRDRTVRCRVVAATSGETGALMQSGRFHAGLYHRLRGAIVRVPALSARAEEIPTLAEHFALRYARETGRGVTLARGAAAEPQHYSWPGNVHEPRQVVEYAAAVSIDGVIAGAQVAELLDELCPERAGAIAPEAARPQSSDGERSQLAAALERQRWDVKAAAAELGVSRAAMYRRMSDLAVRSPRGAWRKTAVSAAIGNFPRVLQESRSAKETT